MTLYLHEQDIKYYSKQEGRQEGRQNVNQLNKILIAEKRFADLEKSANDSEYQEQLMKEFGIE